MTRHELRVAVFKNIFQIPFYEEDIPEADLDLGEQSPEDLEYISSKVKAIQEKLPEIDGIIENVSQGWNIKRLGKAELAILRLAVYEIRFDDDIPDKVAVNEAVELAKEYSDEKAASFINGVLSGVLAL